MAALFGRLSNARWCRAAAMITDNQCYQLAQNLHLQHIAIERKQIDDFPA